MADPARYIPTPLLEIDGRRFESKDPLIEDLLQISVEESLHLPGMFTLVIKNDYFPGAAERDVLWRYKDLLEIGKTVKIGFRSSTSEAQEFSHEEEDYVIQGEITAIETHFTKESQAPVIVRGYDLSHRLHRGRYNRSFQNMTDTDIVNKIVKEVGIDVGRADASGEPHDYVFQENQTNMEFLRQRANRLGFELFVQNGKLYFRKPQKDSSELTLKWLKDVHSFRVRMTSSEQVQSVEVRGWDYERKQAIVATAEKPRSVLTSTEHGNGNQTNQKFRNLPAPKLVVVDRPMFQRKEADKIAQALCDELGGEYVHADAVGEGNPKIRPGRMVKLEDMGRFSGKYYVTETRHLFSKRVYTTEFSVRGLRGSNLLEVLTPAHALSPGQTLLVGIVTDNKDPKGWGRVRVKFPMLTEEHNSYWARVVSIGAGRDRGFDCLPEVNDEVLVAFIHGDIHHPYVIGNVWNGQDTPPAKVDDSVQGGKVRLRTFQTRVGHKLQFVDEDKGSSKKGVYIETAGGHKIRVNDSDRRIEVETNLGHKLSLNDSETNPSIKMESKGNITIQAEANMDLKANGVITVKGQLIRLN